MFPPVMVCQLWTSSSQRTVWVELVNVAPLESLTCQRHHTDAPGGSEPDWRISQVHSTFSLEAGVTSGNALASSVPQVSLSTPYSSTTEVMSLPDWNSALKVMLSGKVSVAWPLMIWMPPWACAGAAGPPTRKRSKKKTNNRILFKVLPRMVIGLSVLHKS